MHPTHTAVGREGETPMAPDRWPAVVPARPDGFYRAGRRPRRPHPALPGPGRRVAGRPGGVRPRRAGSWWVRGRVAFDAEGTCGSPPLVRNGLGVLTRDGDWHVVVEDPREDALASFIDKLASGTGMPDDLLAAAGQNLLMGSPGVYAPAIWAARPERPRLRRRKAQSWPSCEYPRLGRPVTRPRRCSPSTRRKSRPAA